MFSRLLLVFILLPLADLVLIWMLLKIHIGITIVWIILSGVAGAWYVRRQGLQVMQDIRNSIEESRVPTGILVEGAIVVLAGGLLITPGLITDIFGFSMLLRPCRRWYRQKFLNWLKSKVTVKTFDMRPPMNGDIVDGDVVDAEVVKSSSKDADFGSQPPMIESGPTP